MNSVERHPSALVAEMTRGCQLAQMISVAAKLRIADHLKGGPLDAALLARLTGSHEESLYRLLRALAGLGVFAEEPERRFRLTPAAEPLLSAAPRSMRLRAEVIGEAWMWNSWGALLHTVQTGQTAFDHVYGKGTFEWFREHPESAQLFDAFQAEITGGLVDELVSAYDFSDANLIVDVAGGTGTLLGQILLRCPKARGILFDLEHAIASARKSMDGDLLSRCELMEGDMFRTVPEGGDVYILKSVIHDWDDHQAKAILSSCRRVMTDRARLLLIEALVCTPNQPCEAKMTDVLMMVRTGGRERTREEYESLLAETGFQITRILPTDGRFHLLEAARLV